ncbi:hypothetical protein ONA70_17810 [Micromonospora yasonensis]|uniref:hypothetical protein n=1 Tax=Micromonospora yasonensis TaxID=1128667 RepID=UPI00222E2FC2|nr:hypothetical protein [Micromonospora yasonensis]MCW3841958.1 hypothetical protein [Micromonospora yasonensis]
MLLGLYLIGRAAVEPFVINMTDPADYRLDWGGPSLAGVLAVHCGPGIVAAVLIGRKIRSSWRRRTALSPGER